MKMIYEAGTDQRIPARFWADPARENEDTLAQAMRLTTLEFAVHASFMPDMHYGYGFPIGTVFASKDAIVPYGVGNDIGCGMIAGLTSCTVDDIYPEGIRAALDQLLLTVPSGDSRGGGSHKDDQEYDAWANVDEVAPAAGTVLYQTGLVKAMEKPLDSLLRASENARRQMGTLGSGNHFLEYQANEEGRVWIMIHSGSRGLGGSVCTFYDQLAALLTERWHSTAGRKKNDLAFLPVDSPEGQGYLHAMNTCLAFAQENRRRMLDAALDALGTVLVGEAINVHHNLASLEHHFGRNVWVHRKGALPHISPERPTFGASGGHLGQPLSERVAVTSDNATAKRLCTRASLCTKAPPLLSTEYRAAQEHQGVRR